MSGPGNGEKSPARRGTRGTGSSDFTRSGQLWAWTQGSRGRLQNSDNALGLPSSPAARGSGEAGLAEQEHQPDPLEQVGALRAGGAGFAVAARLGAEFTGTVLVENEVGVHGEVSFRRSDGPSRLPP